MTDSQGYLLNTVQTGRLPRGRVRSEINENGMGVFSGLVSGVNGSSAAVEECRKERCADDGTIFT